MKVFLIKVCTHSLAVAAILYSYLFLYNAALPKRLGPNTKQQIERSFAHALTKKYNVLVLGNSRLYRGVNPDFFSFPTYNFAHDDDSYNQMYYKLRLVYDKNKIRTLILGVDYFSFSYLSKHRNYVYGDLLGPEYIRDYYDGSVLTGIQYLADKYRQQVDNYMGFDRTKWFLRSVVFGGQGERPTLKENGQYIYPGKAKASDHIERAYSINDIQKRYFEKIISFCESNDIRVYLVMPPVRNNELKNYPPEVIADFTKYFSSFSKVRFLDFSHTEKFQLSDYTDITHLNAEAAERFTTMIDNEIHPKEEGIILSSLVK